MQRLLKTTLKTSSLPTKYELTVLQYVQKHLQIQSISKLIIDYIQFKGSKMFTEYPFLSQEHVTPLLDGRIVYHCPESFKVNIWNPETNFDDHQELNYKDKVIVDMQVLKDGRLLITCYNQSIVIMNPYNGNYEDGIGFTNSNFILGKIKIINEDIIMIMMDNNTIHRWNITTGQCELIQVNHLISVYCTIMSESKIIQPNGGTINIINLETNEIQTSMKGHKDDIDGIYPLPDDGIIVTTSVDSTIKIWNITITGSIKCKSTLTGHMDLISDITVLPDGRIVSCSFDETIKIWNLETGLCEMNLLNKFESSTIPSLTVLHDGKLLCCFNHIAGILWR